MQKGLERSKQGSRRRIFRPTAARDARSRPVRAAALQPEASLDERIRVLNNRILEWAETPHEPADLVCECSDPRCYSVVTITPAAYRKLRDDGRDLCAPGH